jgi:hypothetical protein
MKKKALLAGAGLAVAISVGAASAVDTAPALPHVNGLLVLPNTKVVNKPVSTPQAIRGAKDSRVFLGSSGEGIESQPTRAEITALAERSNAMRQGDRAKSSVAPKITRSADGMVEGVRITDLDDDGDLMPHFVARREADGSLTYVCVQGHVHAEKFITNKAKGAGNDK